MEKRGILIGFLYSKNRRLVGNLVDLYRVYCLLVRNGFEKIDLLTDLDDDPETNDYRQAILDGHTEANVLSFISTMKKSGRHHRIQNPSQLVTELRTHLNGLMRGFIYLTGHGEERGFLCPEGMISWSDLQATLFASLAKKSQVIMLLDTCHGYHFQLPYLLSREKNRLTFMETSFFPSCYFVLITTQGHEAAATMTGSLVTRAITKLLEKNYDVYFNIRAKVEEELTLTETLRSMNLRLGIYASYPNLYRLWSWFWGKEKSVYTFKDALFIDLTSKDTSRSITR